MPGLLNQLETAPDRWLSAQLRYGVFRIPVDAVRSPGADEIQAICRDTAAPALLYAKVPADDAGTVEAFRRAGFALVDTAVTLERGPFPPAEVRAAAGSGRVRAARPADEQAVVAIARRAFSHSRFHRDPGIGTARADEIKAQWAAGFFRGGRGDALVVAEEQGRPVGFLLAIAAPDGTLVIDLVAVAEACRGRGAAGLMTRHAQGLLPRVARLRVGTQLANGPAQRAYERLGFAVRSVACVFHRHVR